MDATKSEDSVPENKKKPSYRATKEPSLVRLAAHKRTVQEHTKKQQQTETLEPRILLKKIQKINMKM